MKLTPLVLLLLLASLPLANRAETADAVSTPANPWDAIKDFPFEKRGEFTAGTARLSERLDAQIRELNEKRAKLPPTSVKDWDFAMKELTSARAYLKSMIEDLGEATDETWAQAKERVAKAWQATQDAYSKVKASTTA